MSNDQTQLRYQLMSGLDRLADAEHILHQNQRAGWLTVTERWALQQDLDREKANVAVKARLLRELLAE